MKTLTVALEKNPYDIHIGSGLLARAGELIRGVRSGKKAVLLTDETVWSLYSSRLSDSLKSAGFDARTLVMPCGEGNKDLSGLSRVLEFMAESGLTRSDFLIAFGGGVIGDLGGFAAAVYMRGVDYIQIPTTLLAQVDSSIGGKTAVNLSKGKNLAGAFWQPKMVISDTSLLSSLSDREFAGGLAEVIKHGAIFSKPLFNEIKTRGGRSALSDIMPEIVYASCVLKSAVVLRDERESGERMLLNFGHTFGHAIEKAGGFSEYLHGEAVAIGMVWAARFGESLGVTPAGSAERIRELCLSYGLPVNDLIPPQDIAAHVSADKKASGETLRLVLLSEIGKAFLYEISLEDFKEKILCL